MDSTSNKRRGWLGSITGFMGAATTQPSPINAPIATSSSALVANGDAPRGPALMPGSTPSISRNTFRAPSPGSPPQRATPAVLGQRKLLEFAKGPSSRLLPTGSKSTNFSSSTSSRPLFRGSVSAENPGFSFNPRIQPSTMRSGASFGTRSTNAISGPQNQLRGMEKSASAELFTMKIPEPDTNLTGEAIAKQAPTDPNRVSSVYADEYLAHLCPPEFNESQRKQFFCILDLRRLKYAADEIFQKKDWKLNILNFAKEYEKSRSLIMLRYGLYDFKTVKVSKEVLQRWRSTNNIPDSDEEAQVMQTPAPNFNGTEGVLRSGKRKAQDDLQPKASAFATSTTAQSKRVRAAENDVTREPLAEATTPGVNKGKRKKTFEDEQPAKKAPPSATKAFFEKVANAPLESSPSPLASAQAPKGNTTSSTASKYSILGPAFCAPNQNLQRSVLDSSLKVPAAQGKNLFSHLSDAGSANNSGQENGDDEDTEGSASDGQGGSPSDEPTGSVNTGAATPQPASLLLNKPAATFSGASTPSESSLVAPGPSIFSRIQVDSNGQPLRALPEQASTPQAVSNAPSEKAPSPEKASNPEKETTAPPANKTWSLNTPIKFAGSGTQQPASSSFGSFTPAAPSSFVPKETASAVPSFNVQSATPKSADESSKEISKPATSQPTFSFLNNNAPKPAATSSQLFGAINGGAAPSGKPFPSATTDFTSVKPAQPAGAQAAATSHLSSLNSAQENANQSAPSTTQPSTPLLGIAKTDGDKAAPSTTQPIFGTNPAAKSDEPTLAASSESVKDNKSGVISGSTNGEKALAAGGEPLPKKSMFSQPSASPFQFGGLKPADPAPEQPKVSLSGASASSASSQQLSGPGAAKEESTPSALFGNGTPKPQSSLFGNITTPSTSAPAGTAFSFGVNTQSSGSPMFKFGDSQTPATTVAQGTASPFQFGSQGSTVTAGNNSFSGVGAAGIGDGTSSANTSFTFQAIGGFNNPFASGGGDTTSQGSASFDMGSSTANQVKFGAGPASTGNDSFGAPVFSFGASQSTPSGTAAGSNSFVGAANGATNNPSIFAFNGQSGTPGSNLGPNPGSNPFNFVPSIGGASTGTNTPFTLGGASSLATTPATGTPEPGAPQEHSSSGDRQQADGDDGQQEQIKLTESGPGEEDEEAVYEVRAKAHKLDNNKDETEDEAKDKDKKKSPWKAKGTGILRVLKNKKSGAVRMLLRTEPMGHVVLNRSLLPNFTYKPDPDSPKYIKITTANDSGKGLEMWMLQVKNKDLAKELATALEDNKGPSTK